MSKDNDNVDVIVRDLKARHLLALVLDVCRPRGVLLHELCGPLPPPQHRPGTPRGLGTASR